MWMRRLAWTLAVRICYNASFPVTLLKCWLTTIPRSHKFVLFQSTDRSKAVVPVLVLLFVALWFILRGDLFFLSYLVFYFVRVFFSPFSIAITSLWKREREREVIFVLFIRLFDLCLFGFVGFLSLLVSGKGCGLWLWHSLDFSLTFFLHYCTTLSYKDVKTWIPFSGYLNSFNSWLNWPNTF